MDRRPWKSVRHGDGGERGKGMKGDQKSQKGLAACFRDLHLEGEIMKLCSLSQSEGTGSSNGKGKLRKRLRMVL